jgi:hypothetical protein
LDEPGETGNPAEDPKIQRKRDQVQLDGGVRGFETQE